MPLLKVKNKALTRSELEFHNYRTRYSSGIAIYDLTSHRIVDYVPLEKPAQEDSTPATAENSAN